MPAFDIEVFDLPAERIHQDPQPAAKLCLNDDHIALSFNYDSDCATDDDKLEWKESKYRQYSTFLRTALVAVHFFYSNTAKSWKLELDIKGARDIISLNFRTQKTGIPVYEACLRYMLETNK